MSKDKKPIGGMKLILALISASIFIYVGVNFMQPLENEIQKINPTTTTGVVQQQAQNLNTLSSNVHTPVWIIIVSVIMLVMLLVAWYVGAKKKFVILGDKDDKS